jgi:hypothetical protein
LLNANERQEPKFEGDDIILVEGAPPKGTPVRITFKRISPGQIVDLLDSARQVIATRAASADTWEIPLNKGFYKLQAQNDGNGQMFEVIGEEAVNVQF